MDVAHGAGDLPGGDVEDARALRHVEVPRRPGLDPRVAALLDQRGQPADLELPADDGQQLGAVEQQDEARLGLDEVRVLVSPRDGVHRHPVAADLAHEAGHVFGGGDDLERGGGRGQRGAEEDGPEKNEGESFHMCRLL